MMKKSAFLAMCLTTSFLCSWGGVNSASAANASISINAIDEDGGEGETDKASVTFTASEDGKTLTISGKGDITQYKTIDESNKVFTAAAVSNVYTLVNNNYSSVAADGAYNASTTYYKTDRTYNLLFDGGTPTSGNYLWDVNTSQSWNEEKIADVNLYTGYYSSWNNTVVLESKVTSTSQLNNVTSTWTDGNITGTYSCVFKYAGNKENGAGTYALKEDDSSYTYYETAGVSFLTVAEASAYLNSTTTYTCGDNNPVWKSTDNGTTKTRLAAGTYTYNEGDKFYYATDSYVKIEDNATFFAENSSYLQTSQTEVGIVDLIRNHVFSGSYETVKFAKEGDDAFIIGDAIVKAVLYNETKYESYNGYDHNANLVTLDLGEATNKSLSQKTFTFDLGQYAQGTSKLANITLPLVEADENGAVTVPSSVLEALRGAQGTQPLATVTVPDGYTKIGKKAFTYFKNVEFTLTDGITEICDSAFFQTGQTAWVLPTSLETIGTGAFAESEIKTVKFPASLRTIGHMAFSNCLGYTYVYLNKGLEIISNSAFFRNSSTNEQKVLQVPGSVKYIGPGAFYNRRYADVYYYGEKAPLSPYGTVDAKADAGACVSAYGAEVHMGNNGFTPQANEKGQTTAGNTAQGYANRENYFNGGDYIAVLHFRSDIDEEGKSDNAKTFTDVTRKYEHWLTEKTTTQTKEDGTQEDVGTGDYYWYATSKKQVGKETKEISWNGNSNVTGAGMVNPGYEDTALGSQFTWPCQSQWMRSYINNSYGVEWDGVTEYRPSLTSDEENLIRTQEGWTNVETVTSTDLSKLAYMSTRQFVLVSRDLTADDDIDKKVLHITGGRWWTLALPCDVKKSEVDRVFGQDTRLCLFSKTIRKVDATEGNEIHLYFQNDTYQDKYTRADNGKWTKTGSYSDEDPVVLYAHTPYMIYPATRKDDGINYVLENFTLQAGGCLTTVITSQGPTDTESEGDAEETEDTDPNVVDYTFNGNYRSAMTSSDAEGNAITTTVKAPQYSYVFGRKKDSAADGTLSKFWFNSSTNAAWAANKCLVERAQAANNVDEYNNFFKQIAKDENNNSKQYSIFGFDEDDNNPTAIEKVVYHYGNEDANAPIYNLSGQLVNKSNLVKGIYIQNGKKFIVK